MTQLPTETPTQSLNPSEIFCYRLVEADHHGLVLQTSKHKEKRAAMIELKEWADENGWTLILSEGGEGDCIIQELTFV